MRDHLVFFINGTKHTVRGQAAAWTLSDYLRDDKLRLTGTKIVCAEGDCGACSVLVGTPDVASQRFDYLSMDACIAFVYQMDRKHIVTVEGLQRGDQLTDVQSAMVDCHGSQCGFCTPGFVVAMHGLSEEQRTACSSAETKSCQFTEDELRLGLSGNLCRCTGYAQIINAGQAFDPIATEGIADRYDTAGMLAEFQSLGTAAVHVNQQLVNQQSAVEANGHVASASPAPQVYLPATLDELLERRQQRPESTLVSGATDLGVQHNHGKIMPSDILFTKSVAELNQLEVIDGKLIIGAAVTWAEIEAFTRERLPEYYDIIARFGSPQIRHAGTLVGNLANASPIADSIPFHYVAESTIRLASVRGEREVPIEQFYLDYKQLDLKPDEVIVRVSTPLPKEQTRLKLYKISKRRDMDISTVTVASWLEMKGEIVREARLATGGVGPTVVRLPLAEEMLTGQPLSLETMRAAGQQARDEILPISDVRGSADYRLQLVENLFAKCYYDLCTQPARMPA